MLWALILHSEICALDSGHWDLCSGLWSLCSVLCALSLYSDSVLCVWALDCALSSLVSVLCALVSMLCTLCSGLCVLVFDSGLSLSTPGLGSVLCLFSLGPGSVLCALRSGLWALGSVQCNLCCGPCALCSVLWSQNMSPEEKPRAQGSEQRAQSTEPEHSVESTECKPRFRAGPTARAQSTEPREQITQHRARAQ